MAHTKWLYLRSANRVKSKQIHTHKYAIEGQGPKLALQHSTEDTQTASRGCLISANTVVYNVYLYVRIDDD
jgi:hypothetical protein